MYHSPDNRYIISQVQRLALTVMLPLRSISESFLAWDTKRQVDPDDATLLDFDYNEDEGSEAEDTPMSIDEMEYREYVHYCILMEALLMIIE